MARIGTVALLATLAGAVVAEAQTVPGFQAIGGSARIRVFSRTEPRLSRQGREGLKRTDSYLRRLEGVLGQRLEDRIDYYRYERPEDIAVQTGVYATGLTHIGDTVVHSTLDYHPHELVHAVAGRLGNPGRFFHEGLAVTLGDEGRWAGREVDAGAAMLPGATTWNGLRGAFDRLDVDSAYTLAGSFVGYLIEAEGLAKLVGFFRRCEAGPADTEQAFRATYGRSLDRAVAGWRAALASGRTKAPVRPPVMASGWDSRETLAYAPSGANASMDIGEGEGK